MSTTLYILEIARLERSAGKHAIPGHEYLTLVGAKQRWINTFNNLKSAKALAAVEAKKQ